MGKFFNGNYQPTVVNIAQNETIGKESDMSFQDAVNRMNQLKETDKDKYIKELEEENNGLKKTLEEYEKKFTLIKKAKSEKPFNKNVDDKFVSGVFLEKSETRYGEIIKCSVNIEKFIAENYKTQGGYIYFDIMKSKSKTYYAVHQKFYKK